MWGKHGRVWIPIGVTLLLMLGTLLPSVFAASDVPQEVQNINTVGDSSFPNQFTPVGEAVFFTAEDRTNGRELWLTDAAGTRLVRDINPNAASSNPAELTAVGNVLFLLPPMLPMAMRCGAAMARRLGRHQCA